MVPLGVAFPKRLMVLSGMDNGEKTETKPKRPVSPVNGQPVPNGRPKGVPNKSTTQFKEALNNLLEISAPQMVQWLGEIKDPEKRFDVLAKFAEYIYPKLARQELVGDADKPVELRHTSDVKSRVLAAIPQDELDRLIADASKDG